MIDAGSCTFFVDKPARRFLEIPGQSVVLRTVLVAPIVDVKGGSGISRPNSSQELNRERYIGVSRWRR
jgi:hypothetical protein